MKRTQLLLRVIFLIACFPSIAYAWLPNCTAHLTGPRDVCIGEVVDLYAKVTPVGGTCAWSMTPGLIGSPDCTAQFTGQTVGRPWVRTTYSSDIYTKAYRCRDTARMTVTDCCIPVLSVNPTSVPPLLRTGPPGIATVSVSLQSPAPVGGCSVALSVEPIPLSGGHDRTHSAGRPKGGLSSNSVSFAAGQSGSIDVTYSSSEVGGAERIIGQVVGSTKQGEVQVSVSLAGLKAMKLGNYRLTGNKPWEKHSDNHYGTPATIQLAESIANDFAKEYVKAKLGINDMSLADGGLFDIKGNWSPSHQSHRKGTSIDIDGCARNKDPYTVLKDCPQYRSPRKLAFVIVPKARLKEICINRGGHLIPEETNHCELNIVSIFKGAAYE